jgi:hypothetical protein
MSGFLSTLVDSFANQGNNTSNDQQQQQQQQQPQVPYPWIARWDDGENRYIYINEQTGERSMTPPDNEMRMSIPLNSHKAHGMDTFTHISSHRTIVGRRQIPPRTIRL